MDPLWRTALWQQFGATIDMLENALLACPNTQWNGRLWSDYSDHPLPPESAAFWSITYHTLFWLDLYLTGSREGFAPTIYGLVRLFNLLSLRPPSGWGQAVLASCAGLYSYPLLTPKTSLPTTLHHSPASAPTG